MTPSEKLERREGKWRNDCPDSDNDGDSDGEERYIGYWEEEHSYSSRSWKNYQRQVLQELGGHAIKQDYAEHEDKCE